MKYLLDVTKRIGFKCEVSSKQRQKILKFSKSKYITNITKKIGFPPSNGNTMWSLKSNQNKKISTILSENLLDMDNKKILSHIKTENLPEIIVDFSDPEKGKMIIIPFIYKIFYLKYEAIKKNIKLF